MTRLPPIYADAKESLMDIAPVSIEDDASDLIFLILDQKRSTRQMPTTAETLKFIQEHSRTYLSISRPSFRRKSSSSSLSSTPSTVSPLEPNLPVFSSTDTTPVASAPGTPATNAKRRSFLRWPSNHKKEQTTRRHKAQVGATIVDRLDLSDASINGTLHTVSFGLYEGKPACMIVVDVRLCYQPSHTIDEAKIRFRFGTDEQQGQPDNPAELQSCDPMSSSSSMITSALAPEELTGAMSTYTEETSHQPACSLTAGLPDHGGAKIGYTGNFKQTLTMYKQWRIQGRTERLNQHNFEDSYEWKIMQNDISADSVPRRMRVGMIVRLPEDQSEFFVETQIEGSLRGFHWCNGSKTLARKWLSVPCAAEMKEVLTLRQLEALVAQGNEMVIPAMQPATLVVTSAAPSIATTQVATAVEIKETVTVEAKQEAHEHEKN